MKKALLIALILVTSLVFSQKTISENYEFRYITSKKNSKFLEGNTSNYSVSVPKEHKKIQVRFKMKSISGEKEDFDPNKFSLVSEKYKFRLRPIDLKHNYAVGMVFIGFPYLVDFNPKDEKIKQCVKYKPEIEDTFWDYQIEGYQDISPSINFGTKRKPKRVSPYLDHKELRACRIDVYFSVPKDLEKGKVYYGNEIIADFEL